MLGRHVYLCILLALLVPNVHGAEPAGQPRLTDAQIKDLNALADKAAAIVAPDNAAQQILVKLEMMKAMQRLLDKREASTHIAKVKELLSQAAAEAEAARSLGASLEELPAVPLIFRQGEPTPGVPPFSGPFIPGDPTLRTDAEAAGPAAALASLPAPGDTPADPGAAPEEEALGATPPIDVPAAADPSNLFADPVWLENIDALMQKVGPPAAAGPRVVGIGPGSTRPTHDALDCVYIAIAKDNRPNPCLCTGTLIAPRFVLTAAHCVVPSATCSGRASHVLVCNDTSAPDTKRYDVINVVAHPQYSPANHANDLAILVLSKPVEGVAARKLATAKEIDTSKGFLVMGFGRNNQGKTGLKLEGFVAVRSVNCILPADANMFGCHPNQNLVAGGFGFGGADSCNGDSGGPVHYMGNDGKLYLAGLTSRGLPSLPCGGGGCYVRVDFFQTWIKDTLTTLGAAPAEIDFLTNGQAATGPGR